MLEEQGSNPDYYTYLSKLKKNVRSDSIVKLAVEPFLTPQHGPRAAKTLNPKTLNPKTLIRKVNSQSKIRQNKKYATLCETYGIMCPESYKQLLTELHHAFRIKYTGHCCVGI